MPAPSVRPPGLGHGPIPAAPLPASPPLHAAVWTALPTLLYPNLPLDLIEALMYGREWQLGYDKLPPLPWWLVQVAYRLVGHDFAYYLLAEIAVLAGLRAGLCWRRGRWSAASGALVSVLIIDGLHYLNYTAAKFNHDVVQLPFWALAGFAWHRALRERLLSDWLLLGLAVGLSLWAKYFVVVLAAPMVLFALVDRDARKVLTTPGPCIAAGGGADHGVAARGLADQDRLPAACLCRAPRGAVARLVRPSLASVRVRHQPGVLPAARRC